MEELAAHLGSRAGCDPDRSGSPAPVCAARALEDGRRSPSQTDMATGRGAGCTSGGSVHIARDNVAPKAGAEPLWKDDHLFRPLVLRGGAIPLPAIHEEFATWHALGFGMDLSFPSDDDAGRYVRTLAGSGGG